MIEPDESVHVHWEANPLNSASHLTAIITQVMVQEESKTQPAKLQLCESSAGVEFRSISLRPGGPTMSTMLDRDQLVRLLAMIDQLVPDLKPPNW